MSSSILRRIQKSAGTETLRAIAMLSGFCYVLGLFVYQIFLDSYDLGARLELLRVEYVLSGALCLTFWLLPWGFVFLYHFVVRRDQVPLIPLRRRIGYWGIACILYGTAVGGLLGAYTPIREMLPGAGYLGGWSLYFQVGFIAQAGLSWVLAAALLAFDGLRSERLFARAFQVATAFFGLLYVHSYSPAVFPNVSRAIGGGNPDVVAIQLTSAVSLPYFKAKMGSDSIREIEEALVLHRSGESLFALVTDQRMVDIPRTLELPRSSVGGIVHLRLDAGVVTQSLSWKGPFSVHWAIIDRLYGLELDSLSRSSVDDERP